MRLHHDYILMEVFPVFREQGLTSLSGPLNIHFQIRDSLSPELKTAL